MLISIFFLLALLAVASLAAPGLAPFGMLLLFLLFAVAGWWLGLVVTTGRGPSDALTRVRRHQLLRPGGRGEPFADQAYEDTTPADGHH